VERCGYNRDCEANRGLIDEERDESAGQVKKVQDVADLQMCHPGIHLGKGGPLKNIPKVAGLGRESNPGLPNERCLG